MLDPLTRVPVRGEDRLCVNLWLLNTFSIWQLGRDSQALAPGHLVSELARARGR